MAHKDGEPISFEPISRYKYRLPKQRKMRVDGVFYGSKAILEDLEAENYASLQQLTNVATLPSIVEPALFARHTLGVRLPHRRDASERLEAVADRVEVRRLWDALVRLPERERRVLVRRYGLDGKERATLRELAEELALSRERIRQLQRTAELTLRIRTQLPVAANRRAG